MSKNELLAEVLSLPRGERLEVVKELLRSLDADVPRSDWNAAWGQELTRRIEAMQAGEPGVPSDDVLAELERMVGREAS